MSSKPVMTARYGLVRTVQTKQNLSTKENIQVILKLKHNLFQATKSTKQRNKMILLDTP